MRRQPPPACFDLPAPAAAGAACRAEEWRAPNRPPAPCSRGLPPGRRHLRRPGHPLRVRLDPDGHHAGVLRLRDLGQHLLPDGPLLRLLRPHPAAGPRPRAPHCCGPVSLAGAPRGAIQRDGCAADPLSLSEGTRLALFCSVSHNLRPRATRSIATCWTSASVGSSCSRTSATSGGQCRHPGRAIGAAAGTLPPPHPCRVVSPEGSCCGGDQRHKMARWVASFVWGADSDDETSRATLWVTRRKPGTPSSARRRQRLAHTSIWLRRRSRASSSWGWRSAWWRCRRPPLAFNRPPHAGAASGSQLCLPGRRQIYLRADLWSTRRATVLEFIAIDFAFSM